MNYYLNDFDHWALERFPHYIRFVDDMYFVVENKDAFLPWMQTIREELAGYGCKVHPKKFRCQHWSKGVNILGNTIKGRRVYPSNRIVGRAHYKVQNYNRCAKPAKLKPFISTMNSYFGIFSRHNAYNITRDVVGGIAPAWWTMCRFDGHKLVARPGYTMNELIARKYKLKFTHLYGQSANTQRTGSAAA